jgi:hypothetical protein
MALIGVAIPAAAMGRQIGRVRFGKRSSKGPVQKGVRMNKNRDPNGVEPDFSEDDIQREQLGPRGVPGAPDPAKMTPQREKKTPKHIDQGHVS